MMAMFKMFFQSVTRGFYIFDEAMAAVAELANAAHKVAAGFNQSLDLEREARHAQLIERLEAA